MIGWASVVNVITWPAHFSHLYPELIIVVRRPGTRSAVAHMVLEHNLQHLRSLFYSNAILILINESVGRANLQP